MEVNNIYCIGRNYRKHAEELGNDVPAKPMIFSKPNHAFVLTNEHRIHLPKERGAIHYEAELVFQINKHYKKGMKPEDCISQMAVGIDFTLREEQEILKKKGHPWLMAKGFPNSALLTPFFAFNGMDLLLNSTFQLQLNGKIVQNGNPKDMIFSLPVILDYIGENLGLGPGDIIFTGTPEGVGQSKSGDRFSLFYNNEEKGSTTIE